MNISANTNCNNLVSQNLEKLKNKTDEIFNNKIETLEKEFDFISKSLKSTNDILKSTTGTINQIKGLTQNINLNDSDLRGKLDKIMSVLYKIDDISKVFGDSKSIFDTLKTSISSKFQSDNRTLWNIINYAKKSMSTRIEKALESLEQMSSLVNVYVNRYNDVNIDEINAWIDSHSSMYGLTISELNEAEIELALAKNVAEKGNDISGIHLEKVKSDLTRSIEILQGNISNPNSFHLISLQTDLVNYFNKFSSEANYLIELKKSGSTMKKQIDELNVEAIASIDILSKSLEGLKAINNNIKEGWQRYKDSKILNVISTSDWILQIESIKAMIEFTASTNLSPDQTQTDYIDLTNLTNGFENLEIEEKLPEILNDLDILSKIIGELFKGNSKKIDITNLINRITFNITYAKNELTDLNNEILNSLPDTSVSEINSLMTNIRKHGFDNWINVLLKGDIKGFLEMLFGDSSQAGIIINSFESLSQCSVDLTPYQGLFRSYQEAIREVAAKANEGFKEISQIKDIIPQNLKLQIKDLKEIKAIAKKDIQYMTKNIIKKSE